MRTKICLIFLSWVFLASKATALLLELQGDSEYCLTDLELDHANSQNELKFKYTSMDEQIRLGILGRRPDNSALHLTLYSAAKSEEEGRKGERKIEA